MKLQTIILILSLFFTSIHAAPSCVARPGKAGLWFLKDGAYYPCATTTRYWDGFKGACGCGTGEGTGVAFSWQSEILTAAGSDPLFGSGSWCGAGCGRCYLVTPTGGYIEGQGKAPTDRQTRLVMVSNMCPSRDNVQWCTSPNQYGYSAHFDMMDYNMNGIITQIGWDNPEVYFELVDCPDAQLSKWEQCQCYH